MRISHRLKVFTSSALAASVAMGIFASAPASAQTPQINQLTQDFNAAVLQVQSVVNAAVEQVQQQLPAPVAQQVEQVKQQLPAPAPVQVTVPQLEEILPVEAPAVAFEAPTADAAGVNHADIERNLTTDDLIEKRTGDDFIPLGEGPNYHWKEDIFSMVAAQHFGPVLHRVPGSYFNQPDIPRESLQAEREGYSLYGPGTPIYIGDDQMCTVAATGIDSEGRKVAITAGHCGKVGEEVTSADSWRVGPSGTVVAKGENLDYSVIELGSNAKVTNSYNGVTITQLRGTKLNEGEMACKRGVATGRSCGFTWLTDEDSHMTQMCATAGDSGGPVLKNGKLVGLVSGGVFPNYDLSCRSPWQGGLFMPTISVSADAVFNDIDRSGGVGSGLRLVQE